MTETFLYNIIRFKNVYAKQEFLKEKYRLSSVLTKFFIVIRFLWCLCTDKNVVSQKYFSEYWRIIRLKN